MRLGWSSVRAAKAFVKCFTKSWHVLCGILDIRDRFYHDVY